MATWPLAGTARAYPEIDVVQWRQKASAVMFPDDTTGIARHLADGARRLQGRYDHIVLRELPTLAGHPRRLHDWTRLAIAVAQKWAQGERRRSIGTRNARRLGTSAATPAAR